MQGSAILSVGIFGLALVLQVPAIAGPSGSKPWAKYCTFAGIPANPHGKEQFDLLMQAFVSECAAPQACVLSCIRSQCGNECFHVCRAGGSSYGSPEALADMFAAKDPRVCAAPPNNSLKRTAAGRLR